MRSSDPSGLLSASKSMIREGGFSPRACIGASFSVFAPGLHRRVLLGQRGAQRRHVVEDEVERGVEQAAGAHRRLDEAFWKLSHLNNGEISGVFWRGTDTEIPFLLECWRGASAISYAFWPGTPMATAQRGLIQVRLADCTTVTRQEKEFPYQCPPKNTRNLPVVQV
jgi:hypothetical protein